MVVAYFAEVRWDYRYGIITGPDFDSEQALNEGTTRVRSFVDAQQALRWLQAEHNVVPNIEIPSATVGGFNVAGRT